MTLIADILMISGAFGAALYCMILSRRLSKFSDLDGGVGKAIADLNLEVAELARTLQAAREASSASAETLSALTERAESVAQRLEVHLAQTDNTGPTLKRTAPEPVAKPRPPVAEKPVAEPEPGTGMPAFVRGRAGRTAAE